MDEKQLELLYNDYAKNKGFKDYSEFKGLMSSEANRKMFFDDSNKELGFKDYDEFVDVIGLKKKVGSNDVAISSPITSVSPLQKGAKEALQEGAGLADNSFLKQVSSPAPFRSLAPKEEDLLPSNNKGLGEVSLKEKKQPKQYYNTALEKGIVFTDDTQIAPGSKITEADAKKLPLEVTIKNKFAQDYIDKIRKEPTNYEVDGAYFDFYMDPMGGIHMNIAQNAIDQFVVKAADIFSGAATMLRDASSLGVQNPELYTKEGEPTKAAEAATWLSDPLGKVVLGLNGIRSDFEGDLQFHGKLPDTMFGKLVSGGLGIVPDIVGAALLPEVELFAGAGLLSKAGKFFTKKFPLYLGGTRALSEYSREREVGKTPLESVVGSAEAGTKGYAEGLVMELAGMGSSKATKEIMKPLEKMGLTGTKGQITKEGINTITDAIGYGALLPVASAAMEGETPTEDDFIQGVGLSIPFSVMRIIKNAKTNAQLNDAVDKIESLQAGISLSNFVDATTPSIIEVYKSKETAAELNIKSLEFAKKARETTDLKLKQDYIMQSSAAKKAANVKQIAETVINDKNDFKEFRESNLPENIKQAFLDKAAQVYKELNPTEQQKTELGKRITQAQTFVDEMTKQMEAETDPVKKAELKYKIDETTKLLEKQNTDLTDIIASQAKEREDYNKEEPQPKEKKLRKPSQKKIQKDIDSGNLVSFTYASESEVPEVFKDKITSIGETNGVKFVRVTVPKSVADYELSRVKEPTGTKKYVVDGVEVSQEEFEAMKGKPTGTKEIIEPTEIGGLKVIKRAQDAPNGEPVYEVEGGRFLTADGKELKGAKVELPKAEAKPTEVIEEVGLEEPVSTQKVKIPGTKQSKPIPLSDFTLEQDGEIVFTKRIKKDEGGVSGVEPLNQFKLNQGMDANGNPYPRVHVILDNAAAEKYQATLSIGGKKVAKNPEFRDEINRIAKENRSKDNEVVLDFRKSETDLLSKKAKVEPVEVVEKIEPVVTQEEIKSTANKIRGLKIKVDKNVLQSNVAGVPIAVYNVAIEAIARSVEAGETIAKAVKDAIKKYKLDENKGFKLDEFTKGITSKLPESKYKKGDVLDIEEGDYKTATKIIKQNKENFKKNPEAVTPEPQLDKNGKPKIEVTVGDDGKRNVQVIYKSVPYNLENGALKFVSKDRKKAVDVLADRLVEDYNENKDKPEISAAIGWYGNMRNWFQKNFGANIEMFGQLLAATSARTEVVDNFKQAVDAMRNLSKGKYNELLKDYDNHVKSIKSLSTEQLLKKWQEKNPNKRLSEFNADDYRRFLVNQYEKVPLRSNGKKFNANSKKVLQALHGNWIEQTEGPKTKNFAGNLTGRSFEATIDVWAARYLRRKIFEGKTKEWRILPQSEGGVQYSMLKSGEMSGDYPFAEEVMKKAADKLGVKADDLQAFLWYLEKDVWDKNNWTNVTGKKKASFEETAQGITSDRYQAGITTFKDAETFDPIKFEEERKSIEKEIGNIPGIIASRVNPSEGEFVSENQGTFSEPTFDVEFTVEKGADISNVIKRINEIQEEYNQDATIISRFVDANHPNARPIIEVGLATPVAQSDIINDVKKTLADLNVRGFTIARDRQGKILGLRSQFIPEFEDNVQMEEGIQRFVNAFEKIKEKYANNKEISYLSANSVDSQIKFKENGTTKNEQNDGNRPSEQGVQGKLPKQEGRPTEGISDISKEQGEPNAGQRGRTGDGVVPEPTVPPISESTETSKEKVKSVVANIRKAKIDLSKLSDGGPQVNILGLPVAVYNAALETVALAIESGATLADAIYYAIEKHKLDRKEKFNKAELIKQLEELTGEKVVLENRRKNLADEFAIAEMRKGERSIKNAKNKIIKDNFGKIVDQLLNNNKIDRIC